MKTATVYDIGNEIFTLCTKCKTKMHHVITKMNDGKIIKVMCKGCNTTHAFADKTAKLSKTASKGNSNTEKKPKTVRRRRKKDWESLQADINGDEIVDYALDQDFSQIIAIRHKQFGIGIIHKVLSDQQIEVIFKEGTKILVHNFRTQ